MKLQKKQQQGSEELFATITAEIREAFHRLPREEFTALMTEIKAIISSNCPMPDRLKTTLKIVPKKINSATLTPLCILVIWSSTAHEVIHSFPI